MSKRKYIVRTPVTVEVCVRVRAANKEEAIAKANDLVNELVPMYQGYDSDIEYPILVGLGSDGGDDCAWFDCLDQCDIFLKEETKAELEQKDPHFFSVGPKIVEGMLTDHSDRLLSHGPYGFLVGAGEVGGASGHAWQSMRRGADYMGQLESLFEIRILDVLSHQAVRSRAVETGESVISAPSLDRHYSERRSALIPGSLGNDFRDGCHARIRFAPSLSHDHGRDDFFLIRLTRNRQNRQRNERKMDNSMHRDSDIRRSSLASR